MGRIGCVRLRKIPMRLRGTNFCTSSARFAPSFVRQPNGHECTQIIQNAPKRQFWVEWVDRVRSLRKVRCDFVAQTFALVRPVLHQVRKATKRSRMHPNSTKRNKHQFVVQCGGLGVFVAKNSNATSGHELFALVRSVLQRVS